MGCQTKIAQKILDKDADYLLALKGNQEYLEKRVKKE
jgi:predicted transposase YbfD/YdcC